MTFSNQWNSIYQQGNHLSIWPWSDLVSMVMRYGKPLTPETRVVELGVGAGANVPLFLNLGVDYYAVDGSPHMISLLQERYPQIKERFIAGDFTREIPFPGLFDLVIDRSSITHNSTESIQRCLKLVQDKLKSGGKLLGFDWFSMKHSDFQKGEFVDDENTKKFEDGIFAHVGKVHFSDEKHLRYLLEDFDLRLLEHKTAERMEPRDGWHFASWNFMAVKK